MARLFKIIAIALGIVLALVAGLFGVLVIGAILLVVGVLALFGKGKFNVTVNRGPRAGAGRPGPGVSPHAGGDVIDIEARKVEAPPRELT